MKRFLMLISIVAILSSGFNAVSQNITNYSFTPASGTYTALTGGTTMALSGGNLDDGYFNNIPIGFIFYYMGVPYTTISAATNGWFTFNQALSAAGGTNNLTSGTPRPVIAPLWDDLELQSNDHFSFLTLGSSPNRVFTVEWLYMFWNYNATDSVISFQVNLYETSGKVEFIYRDQGAAVVGGSASIGISGILSGSGNFLSLDGTGTNPAASSITETNSLNTKPVTGQTYTFTPVQNITPEPPTNLSFSSIGPTSLTVNWNDNSTTETYFVISRSDDGGVTYPYNTSVISTTTAGTGTAYNLPVAGLSIGTTYYFRVTANNEASASSSYIQGSQATNAGILSGTKNVPGDYATLTAAFTDINTNGLAGDLSIVLGSTYTSNGETYPIAGPLATSVSTFSVTIYPSISGLSISSSNTTGTIDLNNSKNIIFDGRVNATGSVKDLVIENKATSGFAIRYINDATSNTIKYCILKGVNSSSTSGVILFSTTTGTTGNDNNTIDNCNVRDGSTTPTNIIYSAGTSTTTTHYNSGNIINNNNIFNFYNSTSTSNGGIGINISSNNADWIISGNSIYQTASRSTFGSGATVNGILVSSGSVTNFTISGNYIGGTAPQCGGSALTLGNASVIFRPIQLSMGASPATSIQGNTIQNFSITTSNASTAQSCISLVTGSFNCGNITGNTIGSGSSTGSIVFIHSGTSTAPIFSGILTGTGTPGVINILNNSIGGISVSTSSSASVSVRGIGVQGSATSYTISNNIIGSASTANSITNSTNQSLIGIFSTSTSSTNITSNNLVANLSQTGTTTGNTLRGILLQGSTGGAFNTADNTVRNLTSVSTSTGTSSAASVIGISHTAATTAGQAIAHNQVYDLANTTGSAAAGVVGIYYSGPTTGTNLVARNFVFGLSLSTTSSSGFITGINIGAGLTTFQNNMVALGNDISTGYAITGINDISGTNTYYFNSVYIGGINVGGATATYAFNSSVTTNTRIFKDNIFFNARSNGGSGSGKHYAVKYGGTGVNPAGLSADYNVFFANGTGNVFGYYNADISSIEAWQSATGKDYNSFNANPVYNGPTSSPPDLHIHPTDLTPIESAGTAITGIIDDYDGQTRADYTPTDIGADAGNFTGVDLFGPIITYNLLQITSSTSNRSFSNVDITDNSNVNTTPGTSPRVYYKRKTDANTYIDNTSASNGWKYDEANGTSSPFDFTIHYSLLYGGTGGEVGDTLQYFVVAQDQAITPNVSINTGVFAVQPSSVDLTATAFPVTGTINYYRIVYGYAGTYNVGSDQTYRCLTADADTGFFKAVNFGIVTGNITVNIASNLNESGAIALNQWVEEGGGNYTLTIQPSSSSSSPITTIKTISGTYPGGLIRLNGADRVTFDGRSEGSGNYLQFINNAASGAVFQLVSLGNNTGATNITIRNCNLNMGSNTSGTYGISIGGSAVASTGADNDNNTIRNNNISKVYVGIWAQGFTTANPGLMDNIQILENSIGSDNAAEYIGHDGIIAGNGTGGILAQNTVYNIITTSATPVGITLSSGFISSFVRRNRIHDITYSGTSGYGGRGMFINTGNASSNLTIDNNLVYNIMGDGWSSFSGSSMVGMYFDGSMGGLKIYYNSVYMSGEFSRNTSTLTTAILFNTSTITNIDLRDNIFQNTMENTYVTTDKNYAIYSSAQNSSFININYNDYYASGPQGILGYLGSDKATLTDWQAVSSQDANSINADPLFSDADLHLMNPESPAIGKATALAEVVADFSNIARHSSHPTIGAHEYPPTIIWTGTYDILWNNANNWSLGIIPDGTYWIIIPTSPTGGNFPVIPNGVTTDCLRLTIENGATLNAQNGGILHVNGVIDY